MPADAGVAPAFGRGCLHVIEKPCEEAREEEGADREVEDENVVDETVVFEAEELGGGRDGDGKTNAVADSDDDGADVEGPGQCHRHQNVSNGH